MFILNNKIMFIITFFYFKIYVLFAFSAICSLILVEYYKNALFNCYGNF
jgi:hypothetical protein